MIVMFGAGILGFLLRRSGYSIPGIVLGIILGKIGEQNFAQGMQMVHYDLLTYFSRPICTILDHCWCHHTWCRCLQSIGVKSRWRKSGIETGSLERVHNSITFTLPRHCDHVSDLGSVFSCGSDQRISRHWPSPSCNGYIDPGH